jgi:cytochrome c553
VVRVMRIYGSRLSDEEAAKITAHLAEGKTY